MSKISTDYDNEVKQFTDAMRYKLHANRHKGKWEGATIENLFALLRKEVDELEAEINSPNQNQMAIILEAADIGNFAMIISNIAMRMATGELVQHMPSNAELRQQIDNMPLNVKPHRDPVKGDLAATGALVGGRPDVAGGAHPSDPASMWSERRPDVQEMGEKAAQQVKEKGIV